MTPFNADEIFEMAVDVETNGERFYRLASEKAEEPRIRTLLSDLADWEARHRVIFEGMRREFARRRPELQPYDPDFEYEAYFRCVTEGKVFDPRDAQRAAAGPLRGVYTFALAREKESILLYTGMKEMVGEDLGRSKIDDIIREEMRHVTILTDELNRLDNESR
jgi:rubrerythrin